MQSCCLKSLSLAKTRLADKEGVALCGALESNTTLRTLDLNSNDLTERTAGAMAHVLSVRAGGGGVAQCMAPSSYELHAHVDAGAVGHLTCILVYHLKLCARSTALAAGQPHVAGLA